MQPSVEQIVEKVRMMRAEANVLHAQLSEATATHAREAHWLEELEQARLLIQHAAVETQANLRVHLETVVTPAVQAVFGPGYSLDVAFETRRGKTACFLHLKNKDGHLADPIRSSGGGMADVISFALRCSAWAIQQTRPVLLLDEPFKFCDESLKPLAAEMFRMIAQRLGVQVIMLSHIAELIEVADRVFKVTNDGTEAHVEMVR